MKTGAYVIQFWIFSEIVLNLITEVIFRWEFSVPTDRDLPFISSK